MTLEDTPHDSGNEDSTKQKVVDAHIAAIDIIVDCEAIPATEVGDGIIIEKQALAEEMAELHLEAIDNGFR